MGRVGLVHDLHTRLASFTCVLDLNIEQDAFSLPAFFTVRSTNDYTLWDANVAVIAESLLNEIDSRGSTRGERLSQQEGREKEAADAGRGGGGRS
eukprot:6202225-Pleurochrysis_carterae.AAC.4